MVDITRNDTFANHCKSEYSIVKPNGTDWLWLWQNIYNKRPETKHIYKNHTLGFSLKKRTPCTVTV